MEFKDFNALLKGHIKVLCEKSLRLYEVSATPEELWATYLDSFPAGTNEVFRERREHDCSCCRHFIRDFGAVVGIVDGRVVTVWDFEAQDQYAPVVRALAALVRSRAIKGIFLAESSKIGTEKTHETLEDGTVRTWHHFAVQVPDRMVCRRDLIPTKKWDFRTEREVFRRSLTELTLESVEMVLELIDQNSLYKGEEWKNQLQAFRTHQIAFQRADETQRETLVWGADVGPVIAKIRNHSIGTLLVDLSEGVDLDVAVRKYEAVVAPTNYRRPKAIFTQCMIDDAKKTVVELGLEGSLGRRFAKLDDIKACDVLFVDRDAAKRVQGGAFDALGKEAVSKPLNFDRVEEVPADKFFADVLPKAKSLEVYLENRHRANLVSLVAPQDSTAPSLLKWANGFSWAYSGNITDSMKEQVRAAGGKVDGAMRFSIRWNESGGCNDDLDAHAQLPGFNLPGVQKEIFYANPRDLASGGVLDVDIREPLCDARAVNGVAVENIIWPELGRMTNGKYRLFVHQFARRGGDGSFSAEVEIEGTVYEFRHEGSLRKNEIVEVAVVEKTGAGLKMISGLTGKALQKTMWGVKTGQFHRAQIVAHSPNHWKGEAGIGHRHSFFMLADCVSDETPNGFFNEFVREEFSKHRKVFEALGGQMRVQMTADQLSGLGFSSTKRDHLICRVGGRVSRVVKVIF